MNLSGYFFSLSSPRSVYYHLLSALELSDQGQFALTTCSIQLISRCVTAKIAKTSVKEVERGCHYILVLQVVTTNRII